METALVMCLQGTVMVVMLLVLRAALFSKLPKGVLRIAWVLVTARFLVPFLPSSPGGARIVVEPLQTELIPVTKLSNGDWGVSPATLSEVGERLDVGELLALVWAAGCIVCLTCFVIAYVAGVRKLTEACAVDDPFLVEWARSTPLRRTIAVRRHPDVDTPLTYGVVRPTIVVPGSFDAYDEGRKRLMLAHELEHIRRFDLVLKALLAICACLYWFNPLVWVMYRVASLDVELACDEAVVRRNGASSGLRYARVLVDAAAATGSGYPLTAAFGKGALKRRVMAALNPVKVSAQSCAVAAFLFAAVGFPALGLAVSWDGDPLFETDSYSFTAPAAWKGRVDVAVDGTDAIVYPVGHPDLPLMAFRVLPAGEVGEPSTDGFAVVFSRELAGGEILEVRSTNYLQMYQQGWRDAFIANPPYPGRDAEAEVVSLNIGDDFATAADHDPDDGFLFCAAAAAAGIDLK